MQRRFGRKARLTGMLVVVLGLVVFANRGYYAGSTYSGNYCTSCHQIQASYDTWTTSAHRNLDCKECHGSAFTTDLEMHRTNFRHLYYQVSGHITISKCILVQWTATAVTLCRQKKHTKTRFYLIGWTITCTAFRITL